MNLPDQYVVFDFETSGLDHRRNKVIEIGALKINSKKEPLSLSVLIYRPELVLDAVIIETTGITDETLKWGIGEELAAYQLRAFIEDLPLVGHNALRFDLLFLQQLFEPYFKKEVKEERIVDTAAMYKIWKLGYKPDKNKLIHQWSKDILDMKTPGVKYNLGLVSKELEVKVDEKQQHRALYDCNLTMQVYEVLKSKLNGQLL